MSTKLQSGVDRLERKVRALDAELDRQIELALSCFPPEEREAIVAEVLAELGYGHYLTATTGSSKASSP